MSDIIEKIKKLLRMGQSSNQHEAELAIERAFEIAARHNIDLASVDVDEETKRILHKKFRMGERLSLVRKLAIRLVINFFNVNAVICNPDVALVGTESDVEIAGYIMEFLIRACTRALAKFNRESPRRLSLTKKKSFIAGFYYGVCRKLDNMKEQMLIDDCKTALITQEEARRRKYVADHFQTTPYQIDVGRRNVNALMEGHKAGSELEINKAAAGKPAERLLLNA